MSNLHPDFRRSRHPYVITLGSALTIKLTNVYLVTVIKLCTRRWLEVVWCVNTRFPLVKPSVVTVGWEETCLRPSSCVALGQALEKSSEMRILTSIPITPPVIGVLLKIPQTVATSANKELPGRLRGYCPFMSAHKHSPIDMCRCVDHC